MGMSAHEALACPFGLLQDLIAIHQIKTEGAERVLSQEEQAEGILSVLSLA